MEVNDLQKERMGIKLKRYYNNDLAGKTFALWGLAFKPNTDDIREAPALEIIDELLEAGAKIKCFDPEAMENVKAIYGDKVYFANDQYDTLVDAEALIIATEWNVFRTPSFDVLKKLLKKPVIFDGRNLYDLESMQAEGFHYESIGRNIVKV